MEKIRELLDSLLAAASSLNLTATNVTAAAVVATAIGGTAYVATRDSKSAIENSIEQASEVQPDGSVKKSSSTFGKENFDKLLAKDKAKQNRIQQNQNTGSSTNSASSYSEQNAEPPRNNQPAPSEPPSSYTSSTTSNIGATSTTGRTPSSSGNKSSGSMPSIPAGSGNAGGSEGDGSTGSGGGSAAPIEEQVSVGNSTHKEKPVFFSSTPPTEIVAGVCSEISVDYVNIIKKSALTENGELVQIAHTSQGKFYSDASCATEIVKGLSTKAASSGFKLYYKNNKAESVPYTLSTTRGFIPELALSFTVVPASVDHLLISGNQEFKTGYCVGPFTSMQYDAFANEAPAQDTKNYLVSGFGSATVYSDSACTTASTTYSTTGVVKSFDFYLKTDLAETLTLNADDAGSISAGTLIAKSGPSKLKLTVADPLRSGDCVPLTVGLTDELGNSAATFKSEVFNLSESSSMKFYDVGDSSCAGAEVTSVSMSRDDSSKIVYYKPTTFGASTLTVDDSNSTALTTMAGDSATTHLAPRTLVWDNIPLTSADFCLPVKVKTQDSTGADALVLADQTINLTSNSASAHYYASADTTCSGAQITSVTVLSGQSEVSLRVKDPIAHMISMTATDAAAVMIAGTNALNIGPSGLVIGTVSPIRAGDCTKYSIDSEDALGNPKLVLANFTLLMSDGVGSGTFYEGTDTTCTTPVPSVTLLNATSSVDFYYKNDKAESVTINADDASATLASGITNVVVGPRNLEITDNGDILSGNCIAYNFKFKDQLGNFANTSRTHTVNLSDSTAEGGFFSDAACSTSKSSYAVASGTSQVNFYYKNTKEQAATITATSSLSELTVDSLLINIGPYKLTVAGNPDTRAGDCELFTITTKDYDNNTGVVLALTALTISDGASVGQFYDAADTTCTGTASEPLSTSMTVGTSTLSFRYKNNTASSVSISISDGASGLQDISHSIKVGPKSINVTGSAQMMATTCSPVVITMKDNQGTPVTANVVRNTTVNLRDKITGSGDPGTDGAGSYFSDSGCTVGITSIGLVSPTDSSKTVYYKNNSAEVITHEFKDAAAWLVSGTFDTQTGPSVLSLARMANADHNDPMRAGKCIGYTITLKDNTAVTAAVLPSSSLTVSLGKGSATGAVYYGSADSTCSGAAVTSVLFSAGDSTKNFYMKDLVAETVPVQVYDGPSFADSSGLTNAQLATSEKVGPDRLVLSSTSTYNDLISGGCHSITITTKDAQGTPAVANALALTTVNLTDNTATGNFYSDSGCTTGITSTTIAAAASSKVVYYKDNTREAITLTATDNTLDSLTAPWLTISNLNLNLWPATLELVRNTVASDQGDPMRAGKCIKYDVTLKDAAGVAAGAVPAAGTAVTIDATGTSALFYSDATCTTSTSTITFAQNQSFKNFYMKDLKAETVPITVNDSPTTSQPNITWSQLLTSEKVGPDRLVLTSTSTYSDLISGGCHSITITTKDAQGTPAVANALALTTINLTDNTATGDFYSDSGCTTGITSTTIAAAASSKVVYYKDDVRESITLTATDAALDSLTAPWLTTSNLNLNLWPKTIEIARNTVASDQSDPMRAGKCIKYDVTLKDAAGVAAGAVPAAGTTLTLSNGATSATFYTDATCSTSTSTLAFSQGTSSKNFYMKDLKAETVPITLSDSPTASQPNMVNGSLATSEKVGPDRIIVTSTSTYNDLVSGGCHSITLTTKDAQGTPAVANVLALTTINLTDTSATGDFYSDSGCTTGISSTTIAAAASSKVIYYKDDVREAVTLTATDNYTDSLTAPWLTTGTRALNIWPKNIELTFDDGATWDADYTPLRTGKCHRLGLVLKDAAGNPADVFTSAPTATITVEAKFGGSAAGQFYSSSTCTPGTEVAAGTAVTFSSGGSTRSNYYYNKQIGQTVDFTTINTFTALQSGLANSSFSKPFGPNQYVITSGRPSISLGECRKYTITARDFSGANSNIVAATAPDTDKKTVEMYYDIDPLNAGSMDAANDLTDGHFYSDSGCTTLITSDSTDLNTNGTSDGVPDGIPDSRWPLTASEHQTATINVGSASVNLYFKKPTKDLIRMYFKEPNDYYIAPAAKQVEVGSEKLQIGNNVTITGVAADVETSPGSEVWTRWGGTSTILANDCQEYTLYSLNSSNLELPVIVAATISVNDQATGSGLVYGPADTTCSGAAVTSVTLAANTSSQVFHYRDLKGEVLNYSPPGSTAGLKVDDGAGGRDAGYLSMKIGPNKLAISQSAGADKISINDCRAYTVNAYDAQGTPAIPTGGVNIATTFSISDGSSNGSFYSDAACTTQVTTPSVDDPEFTIAAAATNKIVYYKNTVSENVTFTIADKQADTTLDLLGSTFNVEVGADRFAVTSNTTPSGMLRAGDCGLFTLATQNATLASQDVLVDSQVDLTDGSAAGSFYAAADTTCVTPITFVTLLNGTSSIDFRYKNLKAEVATLNANDPVATPGRTQVNFSLTTLTSQITWSTAPTPVYAGKCNSYNLTIKDKQGTAIAANVDRATTISLDDGAGSGKFYSDSGCTVEITQTTVASGASAPAAAFYYKNDTSESVTLTAADTTNYGTDSLGALTSGTKAVVVGPSKINLTATNPQIRSGDCGSYTAQTVNFDGSIAVNAFATETITLTKGGGAGSFFSNAGCTVALPLNQVTISSGASSSAAFYFKDDTAESTTVTASNGGTALALLENTGTAFITKERDIIVTLDSGLSVAPRGSCERVKVQIKDKAGALTNVSADRTLNLSDGAGSGSFYADGDTSCVTPITSFDIANGANTGYVRYKDTVAENPTLSISDSAAAPLTMTTGTLALTLGPDVLFFTAADGATSTNLNDVDQNECALFKVSVADSSAPTVETNAISNISVALSISGGGGAFYADSDTTCSGATITDVTVLNGTPSKAFRYKNATIESVVIDTTAAGMTSGSKSFNVVAPCAIAGFKVEPMIAAVATYAMTTDQAFNVKITAVDGSNATLTCYHGTKSIGWSTTASTAASFACGESSAAPDMPSETTLNFNNGVATTTSGIAKFKVPETVTVSATEGANSGTSNNVVVSAGAVCQIQLKDAASGGGSEVTASSIDLNSLGSTPTSSFQVYAAGLDAFGNYIQDVTVVWSGTGVVTPWAQTNTQANDSAKVVGVKSGTGVLQADYSGGGGDKSATVNVTVSNTNNTANWSNATSDSESHSHLGGTSALTSFYWKPKADAVNAWLTTGAQSWRSESFVQNVRGSRAQFPEGVFIVGTNSSLDIIDATTNVLWMRFNRNSNRAIDSNLGNITAITAINGKVFVAMKASATVGGVVIIDFENDVINLIDSVGLQSFGTIANRNSLGSWGAADTSKKLIHSAVNDLSSVRSSTYDIVAVASEGGGSILQYSSGTLSTSTLSTTNAVIASAVDTSGKVYLAENSVGIKRCDVSYPVSASFTVSRTYTNANGVYIPTLTFNDMSVTSGTSTAQASQNTIFISSALGLSAINEHSTQSSSTSRFYAAKGTGLTGFGNTLLLNGVDANGVIAYATPTLGGPLTVEFWFNPASNISSGTYTLFERGTGSSSMNVTLASGKLTFTFTDSIGTVISVQSTASSWTKGDWHHIAGVVTTAGVEMWVDGSDHQLNNAPLPTGVSVSNSSTYIGSTSTSTQFFKGQIDDLRVSKVARYSGASFSVPSSAFVMDANTNSLFDFENRTGTTVARVASSLVAIDMILGGSATTATPLYTGQSFSVAKTEVKTTGTQATLGMIVDSGWVEYTHAENTSTIGLNRSNATSGIGSMFYYQEDSASDLDVGLCSSSNGITLIRNN